VSTDTLAGKLMSTLDCPHAAECAGCGLIALPYGEQLAVKRARLSLALRHYGELCVLGPSAVQAASPIEGYRTRAKLVVGKHGELGLYARGSHRVVDIPGCLVLAPVVARTVRALRELCGDVPALHAIDVREVIGTAGGQSALVTLIGEIEESLLTELVAKVMALPDVVTVAIAAPSEGRVLGRAPIVQAGEAAARDRLFAHGPFTEVSPGAFVQAHREQAHAITERIAGLVSARRARVLELHAGSGLLALALAQRGATVTAIESYAPACEGITRAARAQGLAERVHVIASDAGKALRELQESRARFEAVVVNPPRRGLSPEVRARIARLGPGKLVYVACEPATLARDLAGFAQLGLRTRKLEGFDMIPQSGEVECLALLEPSVAPPLRVLYEDDALLVLDKPPHVPTTPDEAHKSFTDARKRKQVLSLLERVAVERGLKPASIAAIHRLDVGTSGVCLVAKRKSAVAGFARALSEGQKRYVGLARGVTHKKGTLAQPLKERERGVQRELAATTRYVRKQVVAGHSLLELSPLEGRTHQIRRHLAQIGHPIVGDARYGHRPSNQHFEHVLGLDRSFLHLREIELTHPTSGATLRFQATLAPDLEAVLEAAGATSAAKSA
jgi:23S rRNA (uracil1939-C5)-methyltransferase